VDQARAGGRRLLVLYLTLGDPLTLGSPGIAEVVAGAGADVLEVGLPTPGAAPRGAEIGASFRRARASPAVPLWDRLAEVREAVGDTPVVTLVYPETVADVGWPELVAQSARCGVDGMVLTAPTEPDLCRICENGMDAIPLIRADVDPRIAAGLERHCSGLTYRTLGAGTGARWDRAFAAAHAADLAATTDVPFLVGFGVRNTGDIAALVPHVTGVVIGSEFLRLLGEVPAGERAARAAEVVRGWVAATAVRGPGPGPVGAPEA
jgi:tryptophan synthase alpha chain